MLRRYYLVRNLKTGEEKLQFRQDFNPNYKWHRPEELLKINTMLQGFKDKTYRVVRVF